MGNLKNFTPIIKKASDNTILGLYEPSTKNYKCYKSEAQIEKDFINQLVSLGAERLVLDKSKNGQDLIDNLRIRIEALNINIPEGLNGVPFSDAEWDRFYKEKINNPNMGVLEKTTLLLKNSIIDFKRDNGEYINIMVIDHKNPANNYIQVINQFGGNNTETGAKRDNRYDVDLLINGFPVVHNELKKRGVSLKEAYNQIDRYRRDSFWAGTGLFEYILIFVISNEVDTKYYTNTTRQKIVDGKLKREKRDYFNETSYWSDAENNLIRNLDDFTSTFFVPSTLKKILFKYSLLDVSNQLKTLRPYQICAVERIRDKVKEIDLNNKWGCNKDYSDGTFERAGGYIYHATGSGKTLTAFMATKIISSELNIPVIMVVDRRDLSDQTIQEFNNFEKDCVDVTDTSNVLLKQLKNIGSGKSDKKVVITTIQKLNHLVKHNKGLDIYNQEVVFLFDECHRSQFGEMHKNIVKTFKKTAVFGFTGTPIFEENSTDKIMTTERIFGKCLHTYNTVDSIKHGNTLPYKVEKYATFKEGVIVDAAIRDIDKEGVFHNKKRINKICKHILERFPGLTLRGQKDGNFCAMVAVDSIKAAKLYYKTLKDLQKEMGTNYNIATIFTSNPNEEDTELSENIFSLDDLDKSSRDFLTDIVFEDYKEKFGSFSKTGKDSFYNYYLDLAKRIRGKDKDGVSIPLNECIDIVIVVDMLTTGFDAPRMNTLFIDDFRKLHRLFQLMARICRTFTDLKTFGNIILFRDIEPQINESISLFCGKDATSIVRLKSYSEYLNGYFVDGKYEEGLKDISKALALNFPISSSIDFDNKTMTNASKKEFIREFSKYLNVCHILTAFDDFTKDKDLLIKSGTLFADDEVNAYKGKYLEFRDYFMSLDRSSKENVTDDIVFELEFLKEFDIDIDYILDIISKFKKEGKSLEAIKAKSLKIVESSIGLRSKKELIEEFIEEVYGEDFVKEEKWKKFLAKKKENDLVEIITKYNLNDSKTRDYLEDVLAEDEFIVQNHQINKLLNKKVSAFSKKCYNDNIGQISNDFKIFYDKYRLS